MSQLSIEKKKVLARYNTDDKQIFCRDLTDMNNEPAFFTTSKRGLKQLWEKIEKEMNDETKLFDVIRMCRDMNIKTHYWCMVD